MQNLISDCCQLKTPIGGVILESDGQYLTKIIWEEELSHSGISQNKAKNSFRFETHSSLLKEAVQQVTAYFAGRLQIFDLPLNLPPYPPYSRQVWEIIARIPYGETVSYREVSQHIGGSARAVGGACRRNYFPLLIPCHRVIRQDGGLGGYLGHEKNSLAKKRYLLEWETLHKI